MRQQTVGIIAGLAIGLAIVVLCKPETHKPSSSLPAQSAADIDTSNPDREQEGQAIKTSNGLVTRDGDVLTIRYNNKPVSSFTDRNADYSHGSTADVWLYLFAANLRDAPDAAPYPHAVLHYIPYDEGQLAIVDRDGRPVWFDGDLLPQQGGRYVASGMTRIMHTTPHFYIVDWASPGHKKGWRLETPCEPVAWLSADNLLVACSEDGSDLETAGLISREGDSWHFVKTGTITREHILRAREGKSYRIRPSQNEKPVTLELTAFQYGLDSLTVASGGQPMGAKAGGIRIFQ